MRAFALGPVELHIVSMESERPSLGFLGALLAQIDAGTVRLVDVVILEKPLDGEVRIIEVDPDEYDVAGLELLAPGLTGDDDIAALAARVPSGSSAAIVALELTWARDFAEELARHGAVLVDTERIPASAANTVLDIATID